MRLQDITIKSKLYAITTLGVLALTIVLLLSIWCLATFRVNGPVYAEIMKGKDLLADILPPPLYIIEADLIAQEADDTDDPARLAALKSHMFQLEKEYHQRYDLWKTELPDNDLKKSLVELSSEPALRFFQLAREGYFPAREKGDRRAAAALLKGPMQDAYNTHRDEIDKTVKLAISRTQNIESQTAQRTVFWMNTVIAIGVVLFVALSLARWLLVRSIVRSGGVLIRRVEEMADCAGDLTARVNIDSKDEIGRLAAGINATISTMQTIVQRQREAEEEASRLRHLLRNIIDSMPSVLVGIDADARITQWNREAERITGVTSTNALGQDLLGVLPQLHAKIDMIFKAVRDRVVQKDEPIPWDSAAGQQISDLTIYPLIANCVTGAVVRIDDATHRVQLEELMIQSEKMRTVAGLAAGIAHEINNPLAGMLQNAQVILNRVSLELESNRRAAAECGTSMEVIQAYMHHREIPEMLQGIRSSGERAAEIVANMLRFSRQSDSQAGLHVLPDLIDQAIELCQSDYDLKKNCDLKSIEVIREYDPDLPAVSCKSTEIQQVMLNLLKNAAQAIAERGDRPDPARIIVRARQAAETVRIEVEDNGPGMSDAVRHRIFEPFFTTKQPQLGTGLGLFVSYFIVINNHDGKIAVESVPGKGSKFIIALPFRRDIEHDHLDASVSG